MARNQSKSHAIVIPLPFQGIINPFINLSLKIAAKGFAVTFVHLEFIHHRLSKAHHDDSTSHDEVDFFAQARKSGLDIRCATISDGFPMEFDRDLNFPEYWEFLIRDFPARVDEFVGSTIRSDPNSVHFLVAEPLSAWPATVAEKYNLVNVSFSTEAASAFSLAYHWDVIREKGHLPCKDNAVDLEIDYVPGVESINTRNLMTYLDPESILSEALCAAFMNAKRADFIIHNTVEELESKTLSALNKHQKNYAIGPVNFFENPATNTVRRSFWHESDCASWLGSKPSGSVLYVSFGSLVQTSKQFIHEVAYGLLLSGVSFIWVVRANIVGSCDVDVLPEGYEDDIGDRGIVVPWCDQISVLSNPVIGGFLTHCGWNSTLESMWCGVPMICYPVAYDQPTNRKLVVDDWKIGTNLCERGTTTIDREEIKEKIKCFMNGTSSMGLLLRQEAEKVKEKFRNALEVDGSSEKNFDRFIEDLKEKLLHMSQ
ncbi:hypothetical protein OROHE_013086 [Orobanche hederae]